VLESFIQPTMPLLPLAVGRPATPLTETYTSPYLSTVNVKPIPRYNPVNSFSIGTEKLICAKSGVRGVMTIVGSVFGG